MLFVLLVALVTLVWRSCVSILKGKGDRAYFALILVLQSALFGVFTARHFIPWFLCWEMTLIPAWLLIRLWGGSGAPKAALRFFIMTLGGSAFMLVGFLALQLSVGTMDFDALGKLASQGSNSPAGLAKTFAFTGMSGHTLLTVVALAVFLGLAVKIPIVPFHAWLPAAYAEAPTPVTMLLTGLLSKMGVYGMLRIFLPVFPEVLPVARTAADMAGGGDRFVRRGGGARADRPETHARLFLGEPPRLLRAGHRGGRRLADRPRRACIGAFRHRPASLQPRHHRLHPVLRHRHSRNPQPRPARTERLRRTARADSGVLRALRHRGVRLARSAGFERLRRRVSHLQRSLRHHARRGGGVGDRPAAHRRVPAAHDAQGLLGAAQAVAGEMAGSQQTTSASLFGFLLLLIVVPGLFPQVLLHFANPAIVELLDLLRPIP